MKQKKSKGLRKVFLMAVATALVIAISVSATLAYLTDSTDKRDNVFTGKTSNISGRIIEPSFEEEKTYFYSPGKTTNKDPEVENTSSTENIFTAIKLTFYIRVDTDGKTGTANTKEYIPVKYKTFKKYVTIAANGGGEFNADTTIGSGKPWYQFNKNDSDADDVYALYFAYESSVAPNTATASIFDTVKMSEYINIPETLTRTPVANNETAINSAGNLLNATVDTSTNADNTVQNQYTQEFKCCDFKIKIEGYGIDAGTATTITSDIVTNDLAPGLA